MARVAVAERLEQIVAAARVAWPGVVVAPEPFLAHLCRHAPPGGPTLAELGRMHTSDLYLACACARGDAVAIARFERRLLPRVDKAVARIDAAPTFIDDVREELRCRLLVGPTPRIADYAGSGALESWLCVAAMRVALNLRRGRRAARTAQQA